MKNNRGERKIKTETDGKKECFENCVPSLLRAGESNQYNIM